MSQVSENQKTFLECDARTSSVSSFQRGHVRRRFGVPPEARALAREVAFQMRWPFSEAGGCAPERFFAIQRRAPQFQSRFPYCRLDLARLQWLQLLSRPRPR